MTPLIKPITTQFAWESFLEKRADQNFLQSWYWGETQEKLGKKIFRFSIAEDTPGVAPVKDRRFPGGGNLKGLALLIKEEARRGSYLACPAGPLLNWQNKKLFPFFVQKIKKIAHQEKVSFIRIRPQILNTPENQKLFKQHGFISAPMHMHAETTWQLALKHPRSGRMDSPGVGWKTNEELLQQMTKDHRYEIRKAEKRGVKIIFSEDLSDIKLLYEMQLETAKRHKFVPFSKKLLTAEFESFLKNDNLVLLKAIWQNRPVAIAAIIYYGKEAVYHYSATTEEARKVSASYLILWEAIKEAKKRKMERFNFWGVAPKGKKGHRFSQLNHFKKGFGGFEIDYLSAQDLPIKPPYWLTFAFETLRRKLRKL